MGGAQNIGVPTEETGIPLRLEEALTHVLSLGNTRRNDKDRRRRGSQVLHEHVVTRHILMDHRKTFRVLDKSNEEKPGVEAPQRVITVHKVVASA